MSKEEKKDLESIDSAELSEEDLDGVQAGFSYATNNLVSSGLGNGLKLTTALYKGSKIATSDLVSRGTGTTRTTSTKAGLDNLKNQKHIAL